MKPKHMSSATSKDRKASDVRRDVMKLVALRSEIRDARQRLKAARQAVKETKKAVRAMRKRAKTLKRLVPKSIAAAMAAQKGEAGGRLVEEIATSAPREVNALRPRTTKGLLRPAAQATAAGARKAAAPTRESGAGAKR
jgi:uncharacterized protein YlxW (UPF0749 family)